jgi:hypothetical protein
MKNLLDLDPGVEMVGSGFGSMIKNFESATSLLSIFLHFFLGQAYRYCRKIQEED